MVGRAIELHDTDVAAIVEVGAQVIVVLRAYVHESEGRPGWDAGTGWVQAAALIFAKGLVEGTIPEFPATIHSGDFVVDQNVTMKLLPLPFNHVGAVTLSLSLDAAKGITIRGMGVELALIGEPAYVEEFRGSA